MESVKCNICNTVFNDCFSAETYQAFGCASDLYVNKEQNYIISNYGSSFDTTRFLVDRESPLQQRQGTICDHCIEQLIGKKEVMEDKEFNFWTHW